MKRLASSVGGGVLFGRPVDDLVVDVGEIADIGHPQAAITEIADDHVEGEGGAGMADMAVIIGGDAADIEPDMARLERLERLFLPGEGVEDLDRHSCARKYVGSVDPIVVDERLAFAAVTV